MTSLPVALSLLWAAAVLSSAEEAPAAPSRRDAAAFHPSARVAAEISATAQLLHVAPAAAATERLMRRVEEDPDVPHSARDSSPTEELRQKQQSADKETVHIELFYETMCPACVGFLSGQLAPLVNDSDFASFLNVSMYPFGNAMAIPVNKVSPGYKFWHADTTGPGFQQIHVCQHGSDECLGNLIQACALSTVSKEDSFNMIFCMAGMTDASPEKSSYECMKKHNIAPQVIYACVHSDRGNELMTDLGKRTAAVPNREGTPWVLLNGEVLTIDSEDSLNSGVCKALSNPPSSCKSLESKSSSGSQNPDTDPDWFRVLEKEQKLPTSV